MDYYKVVHRDDLIRILSKGLRRGAYVWTTPSAARTFLKDETEEEDPEIKDSFTIIKLSYGGPTSKDLSPDYPDVPGMEARVLEGSVLPERIRLLK